MGANDETQPSSQVTAAAIARAAVLEKIKALSGAAARSVLFQSLLRKKVNSTKTTGDLLTAIYPPPQCRRRLSFILEMLDT